MINYYSDIYSPIVKGEIDIYDFLDRTCNPDSKTKDAILQARSRKMNEDEVEYQNIKKSLTCYTLNFSFDGKKTNDNIIKPTGFIYIDVDNVESINLSNPYIFAAWSSISGRGFGVLVKIEGLTLENFKLNYKAIGEALNIAVDYNAAKATQYTIQSYDEDIFINNDSTTWMATTGSTNGKWAPTVGSPNSLVTIKKKKRVTYEMGVNTPLRWDNLDEIDFEGKDYLVFPDEKLMVARLFIPRTIYEGSRNQYLNNIGHQLRALNPDITLERFSALLHGINNACCEEPLKDFEINKIIKNLWEMENIDPILNVGRRIIFNPKSNLSSSERRSLRGKASGRTKSRKTISELVSAVSNWDYWIHGKVTQRKLKECTGKNIKTIEKYYKDLKGI